VGHHGIGNGVRTMAKATGFDCCLGGRRCWISRISRLSRLSRLTRGSLRPRRTLWARVTLTSRKRECERKHDENRPGPSFQCVEPVHCPTPMHICIKILSSPEIAVLYCYGQISSALHRVGKGKSCDTDFCQFRRQKRPWIVRMRKGRFGGFYVRKFSKGGLCTARSPALSMMAEEALTTSGFT
jgi:hypothetical protein